MWYVFDKNFTLQGVIDSFAIATISYFFYECDTISCHLPFTADAYNVLQKETILYRSETKKAYIIHTVEIKDKQIWVDGYGLESILDYRVIPNPISLNTAVETIMHDLVTWNFLSPKDTFRAIPNLTKTNDIGRGGTFSVSYFGESVYTVFIDLAKQGEIGYRVNFDIDNKVYQFETYVGLDKTTLQTVNNPILWKNTWHDTNSESLLTSVKDEKNVIYLSSGDNPALRSTTDLDNTDGSGKSGWDRKEYYMSASDVSSTMTIDNTQTTITQSQEIDMMNKKGRLELLNHYPVNEYTFILDNSITQKFLVDYNVGDKVTVVNIDYNITKHQTIIQVAESIVNNVSTYSITFK